MHDIIPQCNDAIQHPKIRMCAWFVTLGASPKFTTALTIH